MRLSVARIDPWRTTSSNPRCPGQVSVDPRTRESARRTRAGCSRAISSSGSRASTRRRCSSSGSPWRRSSWCEARSGTTSRRSAWPVRSSAGCFAWTFAEYVLHRWVFHWTNDAAWGKRVHFLLHGVHHEFPNDSDRLVMPLPTSVPLARHLLLALLLLAGARPGRAVLRRLRHRVPLLRRHALLRASLHADQPLGEVPAPSPLTHHFADHDGGLRRLVAALGPTSSARCPRRAARRRDARGPGPAPAGRRASADVNAPGGVEVRSGGWSIKTEPKLRKDVFVALAAIAWADGRARSRRGRRHRARRRRRGAAARGDRRDRGCHQDEGRPRRRSTGAGLGKEDRLFVYAVACWIARIDGQVTRRETTRSPRWASGWASPSARGSTPRPSRARSPRCPRAIARPATICRPLEPHSRRAAADAQAARRATLTRSATPARAELRADSGRHDDRRSEAARTARAERDSGLSSPSATRSCASSAAAAWASCTFAATSSPAIASR